MTRILCKFCKKPLKKFTITKDWEKRKSHKKCYIENNNYNFLLAYSIDNDIKKRE